MEAIIEQQPACGAASAGSKLRYPLRSASKAKEGKPAMADASGSARGRSSNVSKSVDVLDLSAKDRPIKPARRLSIPTKSTFSPRPAPVGSITPISEARTCRSITQGRTDTPLSDASKSTARRKFSALSSVSYWLTQIKLSESASKHSISLGFFKLALESGCEPLQRMRDELKLYARKHDLIAVLGDPAKDLLQSYNILEEFEQLKVSETSSQLLEDGTQISDEDVHSSIASPRAGNLKPKFLISNTLTVADSNKKELVHQKVHAVKTRVSDNKNPGHPVAVKGGNNMKKTSQKPRVECKRGNVKTKGPAKKGTIEKVDPADPLPAEEVSHENKENIDGLTMEDTCLSEEVQMT